MQKNVRNYEAVSPVVGVMLMLVVTIIIAAVVSAFAGGLGQSTPKAPQVSISVEAHNWTDIIIDFNGGDVISGGAITVKTFIPMGTYKDMSYKVNLSDSTNVTYLTTNTGLYDCVDHGAKGISCTWHTIQTGDKIKINWADAFAPTTDYYSGAATYMEPNVGEPVNIEIYDSASGKMIATAQTTVLP